MEDITTSLLPILLERLDGDWLYLLYGVLLLVPLIHAMAKLEVGRVFGMRHRKERQKLARFEDALARPELLDDATSHTLQDARNALLFKSATGIYAESRQRTALLALHAQLAGEVPWRHLARAVDFIRFDAATADLRPLRTRDAAYYYANWGELWFLFIMGFSGFFIGAFGVYWGWQGASSLLLWGAFFLLSMILPVRECRPYYSARLIKKTLAKHVASAQEITNTETQSCPPQQVVAGGDVAVIGVTADS